MPDALPVAAKHLGLANPKKGHGLALLGLGLFLALLLLLRVPPLIADLRVAITDPERLIWPLAAALPVLAALIVAPLLLYRGGLAALHFFEPARAPADIGDCEKVIPQLLDHRQLEGRFVRPTGLVQLLLARLFRTIPYLTPPQRPLLRALVLPVVVLPAALGLWIATGWFPGYLLLVALLALGAVTAALRVSPARKPPAEVYDNHLELMKAGNPADLFNHLRVCLNALQEGNFPNRVLREVPPEIGALASGNWFEFQAETLVETQPLPVADGPRLPLNAVALDIAAVLLGGLGWVLLLFLQPVPFPTDKLSKFWELNASYLLAIAAGLIALERCHRFLGVAYGLYNTFRFRSDLFWLRFTGTYTVANIGIGAGRGGQFFSRRESILSKIHVDFRAARLISECTAVGAWSASEPVAHAADGGEAALVAPRYLVEAVLHPHLGQRVAYLLAHLRGFHDGGDTLGEVRVTAPSVGEIVGANLQLTMQAEAVRVAGAQRAMEPPAPGSTPGALPAPVPVPVPTRLPAPVPAPQAGPPRPAQPAVALPQQVTPAPAAQAVVCIIPCPYADCGQRHQVQATSGQRVRFPCSRCRREVQAVMP
jgi:hypothetical protein